MGFSTQVLKPNPLWSACSTSPYTIILSPLAYHIYRSSNEQDTNYDCHRTLPPTPNSSQVNMLILSVLSHLLCTVSVFWVLFLPYHTAPDMLSFPSTCLPWFVARAILSEEGKLLLLSLEVRRKKQVAPQPLMKVDQRPIITFSKAFISQFHPLLIPHQTL